jgi:hypothetical protein
MLLVHIHDLDESRGRSMVAALRAPKNSICTDEPIQTPTKIGRAFQP